MSSQDVIKSTAKKLKYYMEVKRLEDAFDLSGPNHPQRHYPQLKPRPTLMYDGLHDRALKHYFRETRVRRQLNHMTCRPHTKREADVRKDVDRYMHNSHPTSPYTNIVRAKSVPKKRRGNFKGGSVLMRSRHGPMLSKGEATRLVNNATRLLVATETVPLENMNEPKYSAKVYRVNGRSSLPSITGYEERKSPTRPKSSYGMRHQDVNGNPNNRRPKSALALTDKAQPSSARFGYDVSGRKIRITKKTPQHYSASESETSEESDDDEPMNILVPVNQAAVHQAHSSNQVPEWLSIQMSKVDVDDEEEEEDEPDGSTAKPDNPDLYSIDNTTQTGREISTQTVEKENSKDTQTRRANSEECMTDPYQADMAIQTKPLPVTSSTQTKPPPPTIATQTIPPPPTISTQTAPIPPTISTQTMPEMATQTLQEISTQTMICAEVQTPPDQGTQTVPPPPEIGIQVDPPTVEDDHEHMKHGPRIKSGRRSIYEIAVHTGDRLGASTRADIFITLFGENGNTGKIKLKQPRDTSQNKKAKFQRGQVDVFKVESFHVGKLECVEVGHDRRELGCGWFLEKVQVKEYQDDVVYEFLCDKWLSAQDEDGKTTRTLPVGNITMDASSDSETDSQHSYVERSPDSDAYAEEEPRLRRMVVVENSGYDSGSSRGSRASGRSRATHSSGSTSTSESETESEGEDEVDGKQQNNRRDTDDSDSSTGDSSESESEDEHTNQYVSRNNQDQRGRPSRGAPNGHGYGQYRDGGHSDNQPVDGTQYQADSSSQPRTLKNIEEVSEDGQFIPRPPSNGSDREHHRKDYMAGFEAGILAREERERKKREEEERKNEEERQKEEALLSGDSIHECCKKGNLERVKQLIKLKPDLKELTDERGFTPLLTASANGKLDVVKFLTISDSDINKETPTGYSCLHLAAINGHVNVMMVLTAMGMSVGCRTVDRQTPLHLAAMSGHLEACKWLVANRAMIDVRDTNDRTPLILAEEYEHEAVLSFLKSCRRELKKQDSSLSMLRAKSGTESDAHSDGRDSESWSASPRKSTTTPSITSGEKKQKEENQVLVKRQQSFQQQQANMSTSGMSFLDSIRNELGDNTQLA